MQPSGTLADRSFEECREAQKDKERIRRILMVCCGPIDVPHRPFFDGIWPTGPLNQEQDVGSSWHNFSQP